MRKVPRYRGIGGASRAIRKRAGKDALGIMTGEVVPLGKETPVMDALRSCPLEGNPHRDGKLHVSDLVGKCIRKIALSSRFNLPMPSDVLDDSLSITFAMGRLLHDHVRNRLRSGKPESVYGRWACMCGKTVSDPDIYAEVAHMECISCGQPLDRYVEVELPYAPANLTGSPDILLYQARQKALHPVEIKSIAHDAWRTIARPLPDHVIQVCFYWWLLRENGYSITDSVSILYVSKGYVFGTPYKEFLVDPLTYEHRVVELLEEGVALCDSLEGGPLPPRVMCGTRHGPDAKKCHVASLCFDEGI